ncbi:hypothetical protein B0H13DRAFT_2344236 [Mycena leptocephala]|nr:hypothetical protein B0H13DRAFT_2344236 [Mycena leptocephala]
MFLTDPAQRTIERTIIMNIMLKISLSLLDCILFARLTHCNLTTKMYRPSGSALKH